MNRSDSIELVTFDAGGYHVSLDTLWEFESAILEDPRVQAVSSKHWMYSNLPNLVWRTLYSWLARARQEEATSASPDNRRGYERDMFAVLMGPNFRKTMPRYLLPGRKSIYLFDAWPNMHEKIRQFVDACKLDHLFLTSAEATRTLGKMLPQTSCHWVPEGIDPAPYRFVAPAAKDIDVLQLGRRFNRYHELIEEPLRTMGKVYLYEKLAGRIIFPTRENYLDGLARSKISICVPCSMTHPQKAGGIETMTVRYLQSMLSKCLVLGHAPTETVGLFGYNPVVEIDMDDPVKQVTSLLKNLGDYSSLIEKNYQAVLESHTWKKRWDKVALVLGK